MQKVTIRPEMIEFDNPDFISVPPREILTTLDNIRQPKHPFVGKMFTIVQRIETDTDWGINDPVAAANKGSHCEVREVNEYLNKALVIMEKNHAPVWVLLRNLVPRYDIINSFAYNSSI
jgi:hypothetical protein